MAEYPIPTTAPAPGGAATGGSRRKRSARALRWLAVALIVLGALALADGIVTLVWQEPITALIARIHQDQLSGELHSVEQARPNAAIERELAGIDDQRARIAFLAQAMQRTVQNGHPVGRISIPSIGASFVVVDGTDTGDLESGPGVYSPASFPGIGFPGSGRTTAIAGHRTTYLAPFRHIDALRAGQTIQLAMPYGHFTYTVIGHRIVQPTDVGAAIADLGYDRLVLSACTPLFSAEKRLLVYARMTRVVPEGAARLLTGGQLPQTITQPLHPAAPRELPPVLKSLGPYYIPPES